MELTGHLTPSVFQRYDITDDADKRAAMGNLSAYLKRPSEPVAEPVHGIVPA
jgi:hypothetical protein